MAGSFVSFPVHQVGFQLNYLLIFFLCFGSAIVSRMQRKIFEPKFHSENTNIFLGIRSGF